LYTISTSLLWTWFRGTDQMPADDGVDVPVTAEVPPLVDHA
jgi:hypothetical protein